MAKQTPRNRQRNPEYVYRTSSKNEEAELKKRAVLIVGTVIVISLALFFVGPAIIGGIGSFWQGMNGPSSQSDDNSSKKSIILTPPHIEPIPPFINKDSLGLKGTAPAGSIVEVLVNREKKGETVVATDGQFSFFELSLSEGTNDIELTAKDADGNKSAATSASVVMDKKPPKLELNAPNSDMTVAKETPSVTVSGITESDTDVSINSEQVIIDPDGSFRKSISLTDGANKMKVDAVDQAGNHKTIEFVISK